MCSFVNGIWYCFQMRIQNAWMRGVVFRMPRSLVPRRGHTGARFATAQGIDWKHALQLPEN